MFYTPKYIVDYIVENTVGKLIKGKAPEQISKIRILDPACGSGSFLIGAYNKLLEHHLEWYKKHPKKIKKGVLRADAYIDSENIWRLGFHVKQKILIQNIFGVDIDERAVEGTMLSLYLKLMENETYLTLEGVRYLPDLSENIKCGNSLIGTDIESLDILPPRGTKERTDELERIKPFDYEKEFPQVFDKGGFDAVIGNPPWGAAFKNIEKVYFRNRFKQIHVRTPESFCYFSYSMWLLTGKKGMVGSILPSSILKQFEFWKLRRELLLESNFSRICVLGDGVFPNVSAPSCIIIFGKNKFIHNSLFCDLRYCDRDSLQKDLQKEKGAQNFDIKPNEKNSYSLHLSLDNKLVEKCFKWSSLKEIAEDVATGVSSGLDKAFIYELDKIKALGLESRILRKIVLGEEIDRYSLKPFSSKKIIYLTRKENIEDFPNCKKALLDHKEKLTKRVETAAGIIPWFCLYRPRRIKLFENPKILIRQTSETIRACFDDEKWFCLKSVIIVQLKPDEFLSYKYLLGLLNSKLLGFIYDDLVGEQARVFPEVKPVQLFKLPIRTIDFTNSDDKAKHERMVQMVEDMLALQKQFHNEKSPSRKQTIENEIKHLDKKIDELVYKLYDITKPEKDIIEGK